RQISLYPGDRRMWDFLRGALDECLAKHDVCKATQESAWYPQRLLHLRWGRDPEKILRLVETNEQRPTSRYITLSHCWGDSLPLCTTLESLDEHRQGIIWAKLPRVFQDCLTTSHELGVQYVWIDSLCIIQNLNSDWARNSRSMDRIYENSLLTIAALSSRDGSIPFLGLDALGKKRQLFQEVDLAKCGPLPSKFRLMARRFRQTPDFSDQPLERRAWAWQERYLSTRMIDFHEDEVIWQCNSGVNRESYGQMQPVGTYGLRNRLNKREKKTLKSWRQRVEDYSKRNLTLWSDRLPALAGLASRYSEALRSQYLAGLWLSDLPKSLGWTRARNHRQTLHEKYSLQSSPNNGVPSWSWASIASHVEWKNVDHGLELGHCIDIKRVDCRPSTENEFGAVCEGSYLELTGRIVDAEMEADITGWAVVRHPSLHPQMVQLDCQIIEDATSSPEGPKSLLTGSLRRAVPSDMHKTEVGTRSKGPVSCLFLFTDPPFHYQGACVLVLGKRNGKSAVYQRLATGQTRIGYDTDVESGSVEKSGVSNHQEGLGKWSNWKEWFGDAEIRTIRII
ncbi:MAG: hypothetical protein Q9227_004440, partial [Pyrenula ochraceoflavens]